jgi:mannose-6-phosphate isomerase-like protein (cupin superfamily)
MERSKLERYFRKGLVNTPTPHPEVSAPRLGLRSDKEYGNRQFSMSWWAVSEPFEMVTEHHKHDFDQFLIFVGGDINNMVDLGGEVELTLSEDGVNLEKFVIKEATTVFVPRGLYHCPLNFKKINDPKKPILFHDLFFASEYGRV